MAEPWDAVLLYGPPWDGAARFSKHHLAQYLANQGHRVLYVESPMSPLYLANRVRQGALHSWRHTFAPPRMREPGLWTRQYFNPVPYHAVTPITASRTANRLGQQWLAAPLRQDLRRLGFCSPVVIAGLPHAVDLIDRIPRKAVVYHCADDYVHVRGFPASLATLERDLCQSADLVITTSDALREARCQYNPRTYWVANGVDVAHFGQPAQPAHDMPSRVRPVVGFVGALAQWVDLQLLRQIAIARPTWALVLVGPVSTDVAALRGLANVTILGPRPYQDVPAYLAGMDVALIPFVRDEVTRNADPIKVYEYLASGVPVVATDLPGLRRLSGVVRLAATPDEFVAQIEAALAEDRVPAAARRRREAEHHSWQSRFVQVERLIDETLTP